MDDFGAQGTPPCVYDLSGGKDEILHFDAIACSTGSIRDDAQTGLEAEVWQNCTLQDPDCRCAV